MSRSVWRYMIWVGYVTGPRWLDDGTEIPGREYTRQEYTQDRAHADALIRRRREDLSWIPEEHRAGAVLLIEGPYREQVAA